MKFLMLLRKELRENLPWLLAAMAVFLLIGGLILHTESYRTKDLLESWKSGTAPNFFSSGCYLPLSVVGVWLFLISVGLGIALGIRQFWLPGFMKTWGFETHRSVSRSLILWAKLSASAVIFVLAMGFLWTAFYLCARWPGVFLVPPPSRIFLEGWVFIVLGYVIYLGTALSGLSRAKWYTTKLFPPGFTLLLFLLITQQQQIGYAILFLTLGGFILLFQIINAFLCREF
jgi:hypothetical protein